MNDRVLLTGAAGFCGSHILRHFLERTDWQILAPVSFRHRGSTARLESAMQGHDPSRVVVLMHDLTAPLDFVRERELADVRYIVNVASESHVDRAIEDPEPFIRNNVALMTTILEYARKAKPELLIQVSTDEVYGPASRDEYPQGHPEWSVLLPSNPYSASKAAQEAICMAYWRTYGVPVVITNTMNIIGEMQHPEKFVPKIIGHLRRGRPVPVHVGPDGTSSTRFYLHARNQADALLFLLQTGQKNIYPTHDRPLKRNVVGELEISNVLMVNLVAEIMGVQPLVEEVDFHSSRPGHDLRYGLDGTQMKVAGWVPPLSFETSLKRTVEWTLEHPEWLA